ncbi:MAG TPA: hypothetical protein VGQ83_00395 [Polyangia bacterium]
MSLRKALPFLVAAVYAASLACGGDPPASPTPDGGGPAACDADGVFLAIYGKASQELRTGDTTKLKVVLTKRGAGHVAGEYVPNHVVTYRLAAGAPADVSLSAESATSDLNGVAQVDVQTGQTAAPNVQVTATTGSCNVTFSLQIKKPQRRVQFVGPPSPRDAFTGTKIGVTAQASTDNGAALPGEIITIALTEGATTSMRLITLDDSQMGQSLQVTTGNDGRATVRLDTGTAAATLTIRADMAGTAGDMVVYNITVKGGTSGCTGDFDCPGGQICVAGVCGDPQTQGCQSDSECTAPAKCIAGKCVQPDPQGTPCQCSPVANKCTGCNDAAGELCIAGYCTKPPTTCTSNDECPIGWVCQSGTCVPGTNPCSDASPCPTGMVCVAGQCQPPGGSSCNIPGRPVNRLAGTWAFDSMLHLRDGVNDLFAGFLTVAQTLNSIINGTFGISGIPSWITDIIGGFIQDLISEYVPPWGVQLIGALSDLGDILSDMRVWSTVQLTAGAQPDLYRASEHWDLIGFKFKGQDIITAPEDIPEVGTVNVDDYVAREVCGTYYADKHVIHNAVGGLVKWAIEVALTAVTCSIDGGGCYTSIDEALSDTIDCDAIGQGVSDLLSGLSDSAPDVSGPVSAACTGLRTQLISALTTALNNIVVKLSLISLRGQANIDPAPAHIPSPATLDAGKWFGSIGTIVGGNFGGEFTAKRQ